ncbi:ATPase, F1/V1 complex, beta/alpha subunit, C-terminal,ATPase, F1/V1/A1 complex, alpha/beta subunit [Cinara cedri]|uniref:H(+)-transporting two-sector ATPase n=1 Tax=Cinara cedri TaxID=506608 RepID=A0A5E4M589_9HEMI|nr:ATPase, F1/V1 complex, beta/alpha subunit, C-terminal,ATPase, F1/V1/A1 complex, alpha/beta subunit [Cinara cedri]
MTWWQSQSHPMFGEVLESSYGYVISVSGSVIKANKMSDSIEFELVKIGFNELIGEIIHLEGDVATIHVYDEFSTIVVGETVVKTRNLLSLELGPGIMGNIYDGVQRPMRDITGGYGCQYSPALDHHISWDYDCSSSINIGSHIRGGDIFGIVHENTVFKHKIMLPPNAEGTVVFKANPGNYHINDILLETEYQDRKTSYTMSHVWPIRKPRPISKHLPYNYPLFTGNRLCDTLLPCAQGGSIIIPGSLGSRKSVLSRALNPQSKSDIIVYVGGEDSDKTNAEILEELSKSPIKAGNVPGYLANKTALIVNSLCMPAACHIASLHTGATLSEYFRDMGYNACMLVDSKSNWAEALQTIAEKSDCSTLLNTQLSSFFERAGRVKCLGGNPEREGSVSIIGAIKPKNKKGDSPSSADPVTLACFNIAKVGWTLEKKLIGHDALVDLNYSFSQCIDSLNGFYDSNYSDFTSMIDKLKNILQDESVILEVSPLISVDMLAEYDKMTLSIAQLLRKEFLQQPSNEYCPFYKTIGILRSITTIYDLSSHAIDETDTFTNPVTWSLISKKLDGILHRLSSMKFKEPVEHRICIEFDKIHEEILSIFEHEIFMST